MSKSKARRGKYEIILIDPPWPRKEFGTAKTNYKTMTWDELYAFDLGQFLGPECIVFCWTTGPTHLKECALLSSWCERYGLHEAGIAYRWIKTKRQGLPAMPPGYSLRGTKRSGYSVRHNDCFIEELCEERGNNFEVAEEACEAAWDHWRDYSASSEWLDFVDSFNELFGASGIPIKASGPRPKLVKQLGEDVIALTSKKNGRAFKILTEAQVQWVFAPKPRRGEHSRKPVIVRERIVELLGDRPRIELFSRERIEDWDGWGDEYPSEGIQS